MTVVALLSRGTEDDRAFAVAAAEAGMDIAFGTVAPEEEFALASIANEVWSIGRRQLVVPLRAIDPPAMAAFAARVVDELGVCSLLVVDSWKQSEAPFDELSSDEWLPVLEANLTVPYIALEAFGRLMERAGAGRIAVIAPDRGSADAAERAARAGLASLVRSANEAWAEYGITAELVDDIGVALSL